MKLAHRPDIDVDAVAALVGAVRDPELDLPLDALGMLGDVTPRRGGRIEVTVRLTTVSCPLRDRIRTDVAAAARRAAPGAEPVVEFEVMSETERRATAEQFFDGRTTVGARGAKSVVAVASGKGGVGKSSLAANLAVAAAAQGKRVGLIDADVWGYSIPQIFGVTTPPVAMYETMLPVQAHGVRLMSLGFLVEEEEPIVWRGPMLHKALTQFVEEVHWGELDLLLLDLPPGTGDVTLSVLELLPEASLLVVTTPQQAARTVATRVGAMARNSNIAVTGVVENMSGMVCGACGEHTPLFGSGGGAILAEALDAPLLAQVPFDISLREAGDRGVPVMAADPTSPAARAYAELARELRPARRSLVGRSLPITPL
ncbi:Mrp/NBP35 family ATP-binding protein [Leekyejoonella antrihumi]|uniref:Iron-sulfur cluster carrier protein n=1 Tax=Leekyejoonella antrihumi TaxID=1660198 RepID=A0A563E6D9_9MICO|nr:Mrp/NBP35 family ATP-binding protein [Leekyejoonella antrihumi]TWP37869.1 Mrp/NBP35 family ATP-binding protein [Leekyejoonella antrihumi]